MESASKCPKPDNTSPEESLTTPPIVEPNTGIVGPDWVIDRVSAVGNTKTPTASKGPDDMTSEPPAPCEPPAFPNSVASLNACCPPVMVIVPASLSIRERTVARPPATDPITSAEPRTREGDSSSRSLAPETSRTAPLWATRLPDTEIVPPASTDPIRRPYGSGVNTVAPAADNIAPEPINTEVKAVTGFASLDGNFFAP